MFLPNIWRYDFVINVMIPTYGQYLIGVDAARTLGQFIDSRKTT